MKSGIASSAAMKKKRAAWPVLLLAMLSCPAIASAQTMITSTQQSVSATFAAAGQLSTVSNATLAQSPAGFTSSYTGVMTVSFSVRITSTSPQQGTLQVQAQGDFSPSGGPVMADVSYACSASGGAVCSANQNVPVAPTVAATVATVPAGTATASAGSALSFTLPSKDYAVGSYSATLLFTLSAY